MVEGPHEAELCCVSLHPGQFGERTLQLTSGAGALIEPQEVGQNPRRPSIRSRNDRLEVGILEARGEDPFGHCRERVLEVGVVVAVFASGPGGGGEVVTRSVAPVPLHATTTNSVAGQSLIRAT